MLTDSASSSEGLDPARTLETEFASIPDDVQATPAPVAAVTPGPAVQVEAWAVVNVDWLLPLAGKVLQLPYEQAAKYTKDDCWLVTDEQLNLINPALENALKWTVWRLGVANTVSHPLVAFGVSLATLTAMKYGIYQVNQQRKKEDALQQRTHPAPSSARIQPEHSTPMDIQRVNGKAAGSAGAFSSQGDQVRESPGYSAKEYVVLGE